MGTLVLIAALLGAMPDHDRQTVVVVVGAGGTSEYGRQFRVWAGRWKQAAQDGNARYIQIGLEADGQASDRELLQQQLDEQKKDCAEPLWLVLIGHGTFDGRLARFNLRGTDVAGQDLAKWLKPFARPLAIVNCASASGPFINRLSASNRVVVTATKSGHQHNYARFGDYMSSAINNAAADLDKDEQTSLLEAFLFASAKVAEFYEEDGRLASEHALLDDTGDALGIPADWFRGVRAVRTPKDGAAMDGFRANQLCLVRSEREQRLPPDVRARRDELELNIAALRAEKNRLAEDDYYGRLEPLLVELARLYASVEAQVSESDATTDAD